MRSAVPRSRCGWRQALVLLGWLCLLACTPGALGQTLESVLRPGDLIKGHARWDEACDQCHVRFDRGAQNERCMACHKDVGADVRQRSGYHGRIPAQACRSCHTDHKGRDARIVQLDTQRFDHRLTDYLLRGRHETVACQKCHAPGRKYSQAAQECAACHRADDVHRGGLGAKCADCHAEADWKQTRFDHGRTRFPLTGRHAETGCADCHRNHVYTDAPRSCVGCHRKDDDGARGHRGRFGDRCDSCHASKAWKPASFNHDNDTPFVLRGRHRNAACTACHTGTLYKDKTGGACIDCHRKDDKHQGSLGRECQACHAERDWKDTGGRFDHDRTHFALLGKHREVRCDACHAQQRYQGTPSACVDCHRQDDRHRPSLGEACASCHSERSWKDLARFDHQTTRFALSGKHTAVRCADCHRSSQYREAPRDCIGCHRQDDQHEGTLGPTCADCHDARAWRPAPAFDHQKTRFALRNGHAAPAVACKACHADARHYRDSPRDCIACHRKDDKHAGQSGERCEACHLDTRWRDTRFDHATARFALTGRHLALRCEACHTTQRYRDAARDCIGCHPRDDKHLRRFGTACESCHNARSWRLWTYEHDRRARFRLEGAHRQVACEACHRAPAPPGQPIAELGGTCLACHQRDDKHDGAFGPQCDRCHDSVNWRQLRQRSSGVHSLPRSLFLRGAT